MREYSVPHLQGPRGLRCYVIGPSSCVTLKQRCTLNRPGQKELSICFGARDDAGGSVSCASFPLLVCARSVKVSTNEVVTPILRHFMLSARILHVSRASRFDPPPPSCSFFSEKLLICQHEESCEVVFFCISPLFSDIVIRHLVNGSVTISVIAVFSSYHR